MANTRVYYGLYDGQVCNVKDPENRGRIQCIIPEVTGEYPSAWCEPCVPCASDDNGDFYLPNLKEYVWVMFEHGNPNKPVYLGSWYAQNRTPLKSDYSENKLNQRIIGFFSSFIRMFKNEKKIEIGVTKNDPEIVIEEGKVNIKGFDGGGNVDDVQVNDVSVVQDKIAKVKVPTKVSELQEDTKAKIMTSAERDKLSGIEAGANVNKIDDVKVNDTSVVQNKIAKITMPTKLSDFGEDSTHRTVTDTEKTTWNEKDGVKKTDPLYQALSEKGLINASFSVDLLNHGEWVDSETKVDNYPIYKSNASYNINNAWDIAKITFKGYPTFRIFIRSFSESSYDYILVSTLNNDYLATRENTSAMRSAYTNTQYTKAHTRGKQSATNYEEVAFSDLDLSQEYYFYVIYQKDNSTHKDDDRGYFYIPMNQSTGGLDEPFNQNDVMKVLLNTLLFKKVEDIRSQIVLSTGVTQGGYFRFDKMDNLVNIHINHQIVGATASQVIMSGLPKPLSNIAFSVADGGKVAYRMYINTDGELRWDGTYPTSTQWINGHVSYFTNE